MTASCTAVVSGPAVGALARRHPVTRFGWFHDGQWVGAAVVTRAEQQEPQPDGGAFFSAPRVADLAVNQRVIGPVADPSQLSDPDLSDAERAAFLAPLTEVCAEDDLDPTQTPRS